MTKRLSAEFIERVIRVKVLKAETLVLNSKTSGWKKEKGFIK